jgi:isoleucyl-tRNA synthetase
MPFAQWHYPFENKEQFESNFPADFISEAVDQTRGWFYTLLAISTLIFDETSFKNCIVLGHVQDKDGRKMSKHIGNVIPWETLDQQGADAVRWYFYSSSAPWLPNRYYSEIVSEGQRKFMGTLWNTYAFYILYAEIDGFNPTEHKLDRGKLDIMDRWILSRLQTLISTVDADLEAYRITEPTRAILNFVDGLSNWYLRRCRERYWADGMGDDKVAAYMTLYTVLSEFSKLVAPFVPFMSEMIYQNLVRSVDSSAPESVHLCDYPAADATLMDPALEKNMEAAQSVVSLGRACRNTANIKNRQPLSKMYVVFPEPVDAAYYQIILGELNVRELEPADGTQSFVTYRFKPQLKTLGPRYGKLLPRIGAYLSEVDGDGAMAELSSTGRLKFTLNGDVEVELTEADLLIETARREGFVSESYGGYTVALDVTLTGELIEEGNVRELISKIQNIRKDAGFEVVNHIELGRGGSEVFRRVLERNYETVARETLADGPLGGAGDADAYRREWTIGDETVVLAIKRI